MNKKAYIKHGIRSHILALHKQANTEEAAPTAAPTKTEKKPGLISRTKEKVKDFVGDATLDAGVRRVRKGAEDAWSYAKKHPEVSIPGGAAIVAAPFLYKWMRGPKQQVPAEQKQASATPDYLDAESRANVDRANEILGIGSNGFKDKLRQAFATAKGYGRQGVDYAKGMGSRGLAYAKANPGEATAIGAGGAALVAAPFLYKWMRGSKQQVPVEQKQANIGSSDAEAFEYKKALFAALVAHDKSLSPILYELMERGKKIKYAEQEFVQPSDRNSKLDGGFKDKLRDAFATAKGYGRQGLNATVDFGKDVRDLAVDVGSRGVDYAKGIGSRGVKYVKENPGEAAAIGAGGAALVAAPFLYKWMRGSNRQPAPQQGASNKRAE